MSLLYHTVELTKYATASLSATTGNYTAGAATTTSITCNWQPAGKAELELLPELLRQRNVWLMITATEISLTDRIKYGGLYFRVHNIENFSGFSGSVGSYECICVEEKE